MFAELHAWLVACLLLGCCLPGWGPLASETPQGPSTPIAALGPALLPRSDRDRYQFDVLFDYRQHRLEVEQQTTYVNRHRAALDALVFVVEPNRYAGAFVLHSLAWGEDSAPVAEWSLQGVRLAIKLPAALAPGARVHLKLSYTLRLPARSGFFGYTSRQANLGDWYPFIPPLAPDGRWLTHEPGAVGEHVAYPLADYVLALSGPGLETLQIAAPVAGVKTTAGLRHTQQTARNFAWSASPHYRTASRQVNGITVTAFWFPEHALAGQEALNATAQALELYGSRFAPYPHSQLTSVEADFADGMEFDGLYFLGQEYYAAYTGQPTGYLTMLSAHETAHQWWYALVGNDPAMEPFLDEALATYSELIFYEQYYPQLVDWWWQYRVQRFAPGGCVNSTIYDHAGFRSYVNAVYLRGALMLHDLRQALGDEQFAAFLRDYSAGRQAVLADSAAFLRTLRAHFDGDLAGLLQTYCLEDHVSLP